MDPAEEIQLLLPYDAMKFRVEGLNRVSFMERRIRNRRDFNCRMSACHAARVDEIRFSRLVTRLWALNLSLLCQTVDRPDLPFGRNRGIFADVQTPQQVALPTSTDDGRDM